jgi:hypothetical protein
VRGQLVEHIALESLRVTVALVMLVGAGGQRAEQRQLVSGELGERVVSLLILHVRAFLA